MVTETENEQETAIGTRTRFQKILISTGLVCLIISIILLIGSLLLEVTSFEFFLTSLISGILFGFALFFEGYGYYLLPTEYVGDLQYFGSPVLYQVIRIIYRIPYILLSYNGILIAGGINYELVVVLFFLYSPFILSRITCRWTRMKKWLRSIDAVV
ncbi:MAG: hypothetical protein ACFFB2_16130 [Promethearchaeota archaeon]